MKKYTKDMTVLDFINKPSETEESEEEITTLENAEETILAKGTITKLVITEEDNDYSGCNKSEVLSEETKNFDTPVKCEIVELRVEHPVQHASGRKLTELEEAFFAGMADEVALEIRIDGKRFKFYPPEKVVGYVNEGYIFSHTNKDKDIRWYNYTVEELGIKAITDPDALHLIVCTKNYDYCY